MNYFSEVFASFFRNYSQVEIFVNRMKSNSSRGRPIANDSSVQTLFMNTMAMYSKRLRHIQEQEDCRVYFEGLQDKITQVNWFLKKKKQKKNFHRKMIWIHILSTGFSHDMGLIWDQKESRIIKFIFII